MVFRWPKPLFFMVLAALGIYIYMYSLKKTYQANKLCNMFFYGEICGKNIGSSGDMTNKHRVLISM